VSRRACANTAKKISGDRTPNRPLTRGDASSIRNTPRMNMARRVTLGQRHAE
jgi:hypothetical protein